MDENSKFSDGTDLPMILVESKCDLIENPEESDTQFKEFCIKNKFINGFRTSSKLGLNVVESMDYLIKHIIEKLEIIYNVPGYKPTTHETADRKNNIILDKKKNSARKEKTNCC